MSNCVLFIFCLSTGGMVTYIVQLVKCAWFSSQLKVFGLDFYYGSNTHQARARIPTHYWKINREIDKTFARNL